MKPLSSRIVSLLAQLFALGVLAAPPALAQPYRGTGKPPVWDISLGAGAALRPTFEGSDRYRARPLPLLSVTWRDTISFGEGGLSAYWRHRNFRIGGGLTFDPGREDHDTGSLFSSGDDRLKGLGKIDASLGLRAFAGYRLGPVSFDVSATKFTGGQNDGVLANFGLSAPLPLGRKWILMPHLRASWANDNYMQTYFGVTPLQASRSIFPRFNAGAGIKDVQGGVNLLYRFNSHWYAGVDAGVTHLMDDAGRSPISISDTSETAFVLLGYHF